MEPKNLNTIDIGKFVCSLLIVMIHVPLFTPELYEWNKFIHNTIARLAVPFFFVAVGFFLYRKSFSENTFSLTPTLKQAKRLLTLYIVWSILYTPLAISYIASRQMPLTKSIVNFLQNFLIVGTYTQLWFLLAACWAIILVSLLLKFKVKPYYILLTAGICYFFGLLTISYFGAIRPLSTIYPSIWKVLHMGKILIVTGRNGIMFGFVFVALGMIIAFYKIHIKALWACIGFLLSTGLLIGEYFCLDSLHWMRNSDVYISLLPASFFLFCWLKDIPLTDNPIYKKLRLFSELVFLTHLIVLAAVQNWLPSYLKNGIFGIDILFLGTLAGSFFLSYCIIKFSESRRWGSLFKLLY